jgi:chromosome segregation ATPase
MISHNHRQPKSRQTPEPDRLRQELRAERKAVAQKDREIARLTREVARAEAAMGAALDGQHDLERKIKALESKVEDWRSRALAQRSDEERAQREASDRRRSSSAAPRQRLELPNLDTKGGPPLPPKGRRT